MKKSFFSLLSISACILLTTGCFSKNPTQQNEINTGTTNLTGQIKATGVAVCDNYLSVLNCILEKPQTSQLQFSRENYESLVKSFENIPATQLIETCTTLSTALRENPKLPQDYPDCNTL